MNSNAKNWNLQILYSLSVPPLLETIYSKILSVTEEGRGFFCMASKYAQSITKYTKYSVYFTLYTNETRTSLS